MKPFTLENKPTIESGFKIPERYFDDLSEKVMFSISKKETKVIPFYQKRKNIFTMVAAILVFALMTPLINSFYRKNKELDAATLENYLSYQSNINQYDLITALDSEDIDNMTPNVKLEDQTIEDILSTNSNLEQFIIEIN